MLRRVAEAMRRDLPACGYAAFNTLAWLAVAAVVAAATPGGGVFFPLALLAVIGGAASTAAAQAASPGRAPADARAAATAALSAMLCAALPGAALAPVGPAHAVSMAGAVFGLRLAGDIVAAAAWHRVVRHTGGLAPLLRVGPEGERIGLPGGAALVAHALLVVLPVAAMALSLLGLVG